MLDRGNPNPGNIGADFGRLGVAFWPEAIAYDARNAQRQAKLSRLVDWRHAISHEDYAARELVPRTVSLPVVKSWRGALNGLAQSFDQVMHDYLERAVGVAPW